MLSFGLLIACNLLDERIPSLYGSVTRGNLRTPQWDAGEEEWRKEGGQKKSGEVGGLRGAGRKGEEELRKGRKSKKKEASQSKYRNNTNNYVGEIQENRWVTLQITII